VRNLVILLFILAVLSGCEGNSPAQTVEWYKLHAEEREFLLSKCKANPEDLSLSPGCVNARQADKEIKNSRRGWIKPEPIDFGKKE
jgi:hypothetical protein